MENILSTRQSRLTVLSVTQVTAALRATLESEFSDVLVEGEISNWSCAPSGHTYFSMKDDGALLSCVLWRGARQRLDFEPREGMKVECRGRISLFEKRGQYQLVVESMRRSGEGELWLRFQRLKEKLEAEGLFANERKREIPLYPQRVGVITSPTGAAVRDILSILARRAPWLPVILYPTRVQGDDVAKEIASAVRRLGASGLVDVLIVGRGGGSMEDLFEFNDENLARTIVACPIPVISAVGHETDFTISDFVADLRAATPSAAAEIVSRGHVDIHQRLLQDLVRGQRLIQGRLRDTRLRIEGILNSHALRRPELTLRTYQQRVDNAMEELPRILRRRLDSLRARAEYANSALEGHNPELILRKGYAIVRRVKDGKVVLDASKLKKNAMLDVQLRDGSRRVTVTDDQADDLFA